MPSFSRDDTGDWVSILRCLLQAPIVIDECLVNDLFYATFGDSKTLQVYKIAAIINIGTET